MKFDNLDSFSSGNIHIGCIGSHSALEIGYGAKEAGLKSVVVVEKGREKTYTKYYRNLFDEIIIVDQFKDIATQEIINRLKNLQTIFVPNRSFSVYVGYNEIENNFIVPIFGNRDLLRAEERTEEKDQFWYLEQAKIPYPKKYESYKDIDSIVMIKIPHATKKVERGFFIVSSPEEFESKTEELIKNNYIRSIDLEKIQIEEFIVGALFNLDYFYSPLTKEVEFLGADQRIETDLEGILHLTAPYQKEVTWEPHLIPVGHRGVTIRESLLEQVFELGEKLQQVTNKYVPPGIIGPYSLQGAFNKDTQFYTFDVSFRVPGAPILQTTSPYTLYKYKKPISFGERIAMEIKKAIKVNQLSDCLT
jgi:5-formaminoimidazole-4-carboxamide-1-(beta)-D-ribofuranosyl 5'-monophosphate synthetase